MNNSFVLKCVNNIEKTLSREESKKKYTEVETKLKDMMVLIKTEVFRSKRMIKFL